MNEQAQGEFLKKRMIELREKSGKSQSEMADLLYVNKSTLSRVEKVGSPTGYKTVLDFAIKYCDALGLTDDQKALFLRGNKVVVTDTSALLKNPQLIEELGKEYSYVIVPTIVINELDYIKDYNRDRSLRNRAWQIISSVGKTENAITRDYSGDESGVNNDGKIIDIARAAAEEFNCTVDIITYDAGFAARLSGDDVVRSLYLEEYIITKQNLVDMNTVKAINDYYADSYDDIETVLGISIPSGNDINAYLADGNTLIISAVRNRRVSISQRQEKIRWLIKHGADVNKRDNGKYYFPALSHSIQMYRHKSPTADDDWQMFMFLLHECNANPNIGSRNPHDTGKIRQKNDGNMPLMIAAWDNKVRHVRELCQDPRISLNQQDGNGFTALIKACYWGWIDCRDILQKAGADTKIIDRDGYTADDRYNECLETGRQKDTTYQNPPQRRLSKKL